MADIFDATFSDDGGVLRRVEGEKKKKRTFTSMSILVWLQISEEKFKSWRKFRFHTPVTKSEMARKARIASKEMEISYKMAKDVAKRAGKPIFSGGYTIDSYIHVHFFNREIEND